MIQFKNFIANPGDIEVKGTEIVKINDIEVKVTIVSGYLASFNNLDHDGDIIIPGAFQKTIIDRGPNGTNQIKHLLQHDSWDPVGAFRVLREDTKGLYFESAVPDTTGGTDLVKKYAIGIYDEHSIGYEVIRSEKNVDTEGNETRNLIELKLWEGSTVLWGANDQTPFSGFKGYENMPKPDILKRLSERMEKLQKNLTTNSMDQDAITKIQYELLVVAKILKSLEDQTPERKPTSDKTFTPTHKELVDIYFKNFNEQLG